MASKNNTTSAPSGPVRLDSEVFKIRKYGRHDAPVWAIAGPASHIAKMFRTKTEYIITTSKGRDMVIVPTGTVVTRKVDGKPVRIWLDDNGQQTAAMAYDRVQRGKTTSAPTFDESAFD